MTRRGLRLLVVVSVVTAALAGAAPSLAATFGAPHRASAAYAWNPEGTEAQAVRMRLHSLGRQLAAQDLVRLAGPHVGVFVQRSPAGADPPSWSKPRRLSPTSIHAERVSIAAEGSTVVASWVTERSYSRYRPGAPRVLWVRVSRNRGKTWSARRRLSPTNGRVDYPRVAIGDGRLFAVWTSADNGAIRIAHRSTAESRSTTPSARSMRGRRC